MSVSSPQFFIAGSQADGPSIASIRIRKSSFQSFDLLRRAVMSSSRNSKRFHDRIIRPCRRDCGIGSATTPSAWPITWARTSPENSVWLGNSALANRKNPNEFCQFWPAAAITQRTYSMALFWTDTQAC